MWKQRTVDAVSPRFCVFDAEFLAGLIAQIQQPRCTLDELGLAAGVHARRIGRRVVYSPFLTAMSSGRHTSHRDVSNPKSMFRPVRSRYYSAAFDADLSRAYQPSAADFDECGVL